MEKFADRQDSQNEEFNENERGELKLLCEENRKLGMERDIKEKPRLATGGSHPTAVLREGKSVRIQFIQKREQDFEVTTMCQPLDVSRSGYYA